MMLIVLAVLSNVCYALAVVIMAESLLSWVPNMRYHPVRQFLGRIANPVLAPLRRVLKPVRMGNNAYLDISATVAVVVLIYGPRLLMQLL